MSRRPGTPSMLRAINERAALGLLLDNGPLTRTQLGELTGLSKVTASQLLGSLQSRGLVEVVGALSAGRGPNAEVYGVVPGAAYAAALDVGPDHVSAAICDVTGSVVGEVGLDVPDAEDPARVVRSAVVKATRKAGLKLDDLHEVVIGTPGLVDPTTGDVEFAFNLPEWHAGLRQTLETGLRRPVTIENDVNLCAVAEQHEGAARGIDDFVLFWVGGGLGVAVVLGGRLHRGSTGAAGEIGYLPVPGVPLPTSVSRPHKGAFQRLVGADAVADLAHEHGLRSRDAGDAVREAAVNGQTGAAFLTELSRRLAVGVAAVCSVVDPGLVVLTGEVGRAGGTELTERIAIEVGHLAPVSPRIVPTETGEQPVLRGALLTGLAHARSALFAATDQPTNGQ